MSVNLPEKSRFARLLLVLLCFIGAVLCCSSPGLPGAQNSEQSGRSFVMRVDVELVTIEVFALDRKGKPVRELKKEDFRLFEDGKQQSIESFDEVAGDAAPPVPEGNFDEGDAGRGKIVIILFDDSTIIPSHLKPARDSAARFVSEHMRSQDLFAVASFSLSLKILQNFTRERDKVLKAINLPAVSSASASRQDPAMDQTPAGSPRQWPDSPRRGYAVDKHGNRAPDGKPPACARCPECIHGASQRAKICSALLGIRLFQPGHHADDLFENVELRQKVERGFLYGRSRRVVFSHRGSPSPRQKQDARNLSLGDVCAHPGQFDVSTTGGRDWRRDQRGVQRGNRWRIERRDRRNNGRHEWRDERKHRGEHRGEHRREHRWEHRHNRREFRQKRRVSWQHQLSRSHQYRRHGMGHRTLLQTAEHAEISCQRNGWIINLQHQ